MRTEQRIQVLAVSIVVALVLFPATAIAEDNNLVAGSAIMMAQAAAHTQDEAVAYARSLIGTPVHSDDNGSLDCVDVARAYYDYLGVGARLGHGYAYARGNRPDGWTRVYSDPQPGDVATWDTSSAFAPTWGHVAVVLAVSGNTIYVAQQDTNQQRNCWEETRSTNGWDKPTSYLRPDWPAPSSFESYVDDVHGVAGGIYLKGWTFNRNNLTRSTQIHAYLDGGVGASTTSWAIDANVARADVDAVHHVGSYHGFDTTITGIAAGSHTVYLYANDQYLNQSQFIGSYAVTVPNSYNPEGWLDVATGGDGTVYVKGWALDRDDQSAQLEVHIYVGGTGIDGEKHVLAANRSYPSVNAELAVSGNHGFEASFQTSQRGLVSVYAHAVNVGGGENCQLTQVCTTTVLEPKGNAVSMTEDTYTIRSALDTSKALDIADASQANLANVMLNQWNGGNNQKYMLKAADDGSYYIIATHSDKAVEVYGAYTNSGANVSQFAQNQTVAQRWFFDKNSDGTYTMRNKASGLAMDVADAKTTNGANIQQCTRNGTDAQKFYLVPTDTSKWQLSLSAPSFTYTGSELRPSAKVSAGGVAMKEGVDYMVSYKNNVNAGTATVTVTGIGGFTGSKSASFTIAPSSFTAATVKLSSTTFVYDGSAKMPTAWVYLGSTQVPWSGYDVRYSDNVNIGTGKVTVTGKGNYTGAKTASFTIAALTPTPTSAATQPMHRLYNPNSGEHFYTASAAERDAVVRAGWKYEGVGWTAPVTSATPVFRLYNANGGEHHYTVSAAERDMLVRAGWKSEGVGWHSDDAKSVPLYREYNPNAFANNHNYTTSKAEHDWLISLGWKDEGRAWYGIGST